MFGGGDANADGRRPFVARRRWRNVSTPFHLAVPVHDLQAARAFYEELLGWRAAVVTDQSIIWDAGGNQVVSHWVPGYEAAAAGANVVDQHRVPVPHFGMVLTPQEWSTLRERLQGKVSFIIKPHTRYPGTAGEQQTMFFRDPSGNTLEFKSFADPVRMFDRS